MKGLLLKDFMISKRSLTSFGIIIILLFTASLAMRSNLSILNGGLFSFISIYFTIFLSFNLFTYDETCHWNIFALSLPVSKRVLVRGRYVFLLLVLISAIGLSILFYIAFGSVFSLEILLQIAASITVSLILISFLLPFIYHFGTQTTRILLMVVFAAFFLLAFLLQNLSIAPPTLTDQSVILLCYAAFGASILCFFISYLVSCKIVENKDFN